MAIMIVLLFVKGKKRELYLQGGGKGRRAPSSLGEKHPRNFGGSSEGKGEQLLWGQGDPVKGAE